MSDHLDMFQKVWYCVVLTGEPDSQKGEAYGKENYKN